MTLHLRKGYDGLMGQWMDGWTDKKWMDGQTMDR